MASIRLLTHISPERILSGTSKNYGRPSLHILLLTQYFPPETGSAAAKMAEMGVYLAGKGHRVSVVSQIPNYPSGIVYPDYKGAWFRRETQNGVRITRTWSYASPERDRFRPRFLNYATFMGTALAGIFSGPRPDVALVYSPPLFLGLTATMLTKLWRTPFVFWVNDLWPGVALPLGFMQQGKLFNLAKAVERFAYDQANRIFVYSQRQGEEIAKTGANPAKIEIHPLWIDIDVFRPLPEMANEIRREFGWDQKFVVLYGGNIGRAQGLEILIESARLLQDAPDIHFVLMGSGYEKENLEALVQKYNLSSVQFISHQPKEKASAFFSAADMLFARLKEDPSRVGTVPEKILAYMACGRPVLMAVQEGAAAELIREHQCGQSVPPNDPEALAQTILNLIHDRQLLNQWGENGRRATETHFATHIVLETMEASLRHIAGSGLSIQ
jgi:colanic acid biosynthesis glycosyl transferase WcaI